MQISQPTSFEHFSTFSESSNERIYICKRDLKNLKQAICHAKPDSTVQLAATNPEGTRRFRVPPRIARTFRRSRDSAPAESKGTGRLSRAPRYHRRRISASLVRKVPRLCQRHDGQCTIVTTMPIGYIARPEN